MPLGRRRRLLMSWSHLVVPAKTGNMAHCSPDAAALIALQTLGPNRLITTPTLNRDFCGFKISGNGKTNAETLEPQCGTFKTTTPRRRSRVGVGV